MNITPRKRQRTGGFGVSKETVLDYSHRYDRNDENLENLMDRRHLNKHRNAASPSEEEVAAPYDMFVYATAAVNQFDSNIGSSLPRV